MHIHILYNILTNRNFEKYIRIAPYLPSCKLYGIVLKHFETTHSGGDNLFKLLEGVRLEGQACETL